MGREQGKAQAGGIAALPPLIWCFVRDRDRKAETQGSVSPKGRVEPDRRHAGHALHTLALAYIRMASRTAITCN